MKKDSEVRSEKFLNWVESIPNWVGSLFVGAVICGMIAGLTLAIVSTASSVAKTRCERITAEIGYPTKFIKYNLFSHDCFFQRSNGEWEILNRGRR